MDFPCFAFPGETKGRLISADDPPSDEIPLPTCEAKVTTVTTATVAAEVTYLSLAKGVPNQHAHCPYEFQSVSSFPEPLRVQDQLLEEYFFSTVK